MLTIECSPVPNEVQSYAYDVVPVVSGRTKRKSAQSDAAGPVKQMRYVE